MNFEAKAISSTTYILNLIDLLCTLCALRLGVKELNPFMQNVPFMVFYKTVIVGSLLMLLSGRRERVARVGMPCCMAVYAALLLYHGVGIACTLEVKM
ncbi:MAG: hypothetical protein IJB67_01735 [Firmicutes bacterium]|nr:hypothetical protein [Bacillota bacterium]